MSKFLFPMNDQVRLLVGFSLMMLIGGLFITAMEALAPSPHYSCLQTTVPEVDPDAPFLLILFPILFAFAFVGTSFLSGWLFLSLDYRASQQPKHWSGLQDGMMGWCGFRNAFRIGASEEGLYLTGFLLFRFVFPTVCIPWEQVQVHNRYTLLLADIIIYRITTKYGPVSLHLAEDMEEFINANRQLPNRKT